MFNLAQKLFVLCAARHTFPSKYGEFSKCPTPFESISKDVPSYTNPSKPIFSILITPNTFLPSNFNNKLSAVFVLFSNLS